MFSPETLKNVSLLCEFSSRLGFIPYTYSSNITPSNGKFGVLIHGWKGVFWLLWRIYAILGVIFVFFKAYIVYAYVMKETTTISAQRKVQELFIVFVMTYGLVFLINTVIFQDEIEVAFNSVIKLNQNLKGNQKWMSKFKDGLELYVKTFTWGTVILLLLAFPYMYNRNSEVQNLYTYFGGKNEFYRVTYQIIEFYAEAGLFALATFYNFLMVGGANSLLYWSEFLLKADEIDESRLESLQIRVPTPLRPKIWKIMCHKQICILCLVLHESNYYFLTVMVVAYCSGLFIFGTFAVIKYHHALGWMGSNAVMMVGLMAKLFLFVCMQYASTATLTSRKFLNILRKDLNDQNKNQALRFHTPFLRRLVKSLQPLKFRMGIFHPVQKATILTITDFDIDTLADMLVASE